MNKTILAAMLVLSLTACIKEQTPGYRLADNKVLCDAKSGDAFVVHPGSGDISYIQRMSGVDPLCVKYAPVPPPIQPAASAAASAP